MRQAQAMRRKIVTDFHFFNLFFLFDIFFGFLMMFPFEGFLNVRIVFVKSVEDVIDIFLVKSIKLLGRPWLWSLSITLACVPLTVLTALARQLKKCEIIMSVGYFNLNLCGKSDRH